MTRLFTTLRAGRLRPATPRLAAATTAAVLVSGVALAAPAQAADPAVGVQAVAQTAFDGGSSCPITSGGGTNANKTVVVPTSGTKSVGVSASATATATNTGDATDTATMKAVDTVTGSVTGAGGAFSKAALSFKQAGTIGLAKGLSTGCQPSVQLSGVFLMQFTVKKTGKLAFTVDVPRHTAVTMQMGRNSSVFSIDLSLEARGTHTVVRRAKPGLYQVVLQVQSQVAVAMPDLALSRSGVTTFRAAYSKS